MDCKHNWVESKFAIKYRMPNEYMYNCTRCHKSLFTTLLKKESPDLVGQGLKEGELMNKLTTAAVGTII